MFGKSEAKPKIVFAASTFATEVDNVTVVLRAYDPWDAEDGLVQLHPEWFVSDPAECDGGIRRSTF
jgi:hypothetical protein